MYGRERAREERAGKLACGAMAQRANSGDWQDLSDTQRELLLSISMGKASLAVARDDTELWGKLKPDYLHRAKVEVEDQEARGLGRSSSGETAWMVLYKWYIGMVRRYVPECEHFTDSLAYGDQLGLLQFCEWLANNEVKLEEPSHQHRLDEFTALEHRPELPGELLKELHENSPAEYTVLGFPDLPKAGRPMTAGEKAMWDALAGRAMNQQQLAGALDTSVEEIRQRKFKVCDKGYFVEHRAGRGYYRPDAPP